ncbi:G patch domain-containing protein 11 [Liparis tanakae]|uniref:G patch domain-containing protein 11 n=1 Tax=Liparis tanakae TaxID=230148 RepID=A0A4Z2H9U0_9TELE|nr:G patch domain-containing protein 11 [Liparis tanakae]
MSDEEEDYMSDAFLSKMQDVKPGVSMVRRVKEALKKETQQKETNVKNRQKTYKEQEKERAGRVDPIPLNIKTDRGGIGMEGVKKRKAEQELENYRQKARAKQQNETKSLEDFRSRVRTEREERKIEGDLRRSQRACEQLDSQKMKKTCAPTVLGIQQQTTIEHDKKKYARWFPVKKQLPFTVG